MKNPEHLGLKIWIYKLSVYAEFQSFRQGRLSPICKRDYCVREAQGFTSENFILLSVKNMFNGFHERK